MERTYRRMHGGEGLCFYRVAVEQSDLSIGTLKPRPDIARRALEEARGQVKKAIVRNPLFLTTLSPLPTDPEDGPVARWMRQAGQRADVGPMAAVAGAVARFVGEALSRSMAEVVVENGGDLFLRCTRQRVIAVYAGDSPLSNRIGLIMPPGCWGVCTSAGRVGPSLSLGRADAAVVISADSALADAAATALGNRVQKADDLSTAVEHTLKIPSVLGALAIYDEQLAAGGQIELTPIGEEGETP